MRPTIDGTALDRGEGSNRAWSLDVAARDYIWLYDVRRGINVHTIAERDGVSLWQIQEGIERARELAKNRPKANSEENHPSGDLEDLGFRLIPLFPIGSFTPQSSCPHHHAIAEGSRLCCMVCHASGMDGHPGLRRDPKDDPAPESGPAPSAEPKASRKGLASTETRKQRRRRRFAEAAA